MRSLCGTNIKLLQENYIAPRIVLAASGVDHEELLSLAEPLLGDLAAKPLTQEPKSVYVGGDYRHQADPSVCFFFFINSIEHHCAWNAILFRIHDIVLPWDLFIFSSSGYFASCSSFSLGKSLFGRPGSLGKSLF